jgi:hypothetical protein
MAHILAAKALVGEAADPQNVKGSEKNIIRF